jgi:protein-S-isoprenylcysteine O-methyltransferase Ste14
MTCPSIFPQSAGITRAVSHNVVSLGADTLTGAAAANFFYQKNSKKAMAVVSLKKLKREAVPLLFFGATISIKSYFLAEALFIDGGWSKLLSLIHYPGSGGGEVKYLVLDMTSMFFYNIVAILFDALVFFSYLIRLEPSNKAEGFWETFYPLATVLIPVIGFTLLAIPDVREMITTYDVRDLAYRYGLSPVFVVSMHTTAFLIGASGALLSFMALWSLKKSFSLMTEVRKLVTCGLYRRIRHPLYMAEIIHILGLAILSAAPAGLLLFFIAVTMQVVRAKIEENKFIQTVPEYAEFKSNTGFLWPKLW